MCSEQDVINAHAQWNVLDPKYINYTDDPFQIKGVEASEVSPTPCKLILSYDIAQLHSYLSPLKK